MRKKIFIFYCAFLVLTIFLHSCGTSKSNNNDSQKKLDNLSQFSSNDEDDFLIEDESELRVPASLQGSEISNADSDENNQPESIELSNQISTYQIKENDTLMLIAFNLYGDYGKWRELYALNKNILRGNTDLLTLKKDRFGKFPRLRYKKPLHPYHPPDGDPYLIKNGDSLSLISAKVYGDYKKWHGIFYNNRRQIKNPNLIFAGFTLFYPSYFDKIKSNSLASR